MKIFKYILISFIFIFGFSLSSCSSNETSSPIDEIKNEYGNKEFTIYFSEYNLDNAIDSIKYCANEIPSLPKPQKLGYSFLGWYLDKDYTIPYVKDILYLYMVDITLYAKFEKINYSINGIYDISYNISSNINDDSLNICDYIINDETYLIRDDNSLFLQITFDTNFILNDNFVNEIFKINSLNTNIKLNDYLHNKSTSKRTYIFEISNIDINELMEFNIESYDYINKGANAKKEEYIFNFKINNIIGYNKSFYLDNVLSEGYYSCNYHFRDMNNKLLDKDTFNAYIYSDGKNYKFIMQTIPYNVDGLYNTRASKMISCFPIGLYYEIDKIEDSPNSDIYLPGFYNATEYKELSIEYNKDNNNLYYVFNINNSLDKNYVILKCEESDNDISSIFCQNLILDIDYDHIIKIVDCDYSEINGSYFMSKTIGSYYPGNINDFEENDMTYQYSKEYGFNFDLYNMYYQIINDNIYLCSSKTLIKPIEKFDLCNNQYKMSSFEIYSYIYDYNDNYDIYSDKLTYNYYNDITLNKNEKVINGISYSTGNAEDIFKSYYGSSYIIKSYKGYMLNNGNIDYENIIDLDNFDYSYDIVINYEFIDQNNIVAYANLYVLNETNYEIEINSYEDIIDYGTTFEIPNIKYDYMYNNYELYGNYKSKEEYIDIIDSTKVLAFGYKNDKYILIPILFNNNELKLEYEKIILLYEITNILGDNKYYEIEIKCSDLKDYFVMNSSDEIILNDTVSYADYNKLTLEKSYLLDDEDFNYVNESYYIKYGNSINEFIFSSFIIRSNNYKYYSSDSNEVTNIHNLVKGLSWAYIEMNYNYDNILLKIKLIYNINILGEKNYNLFINDVFTNKKYDILKPNIYDSNGDLLSDDINLNIDGRKGASSITVGKGYYYLYVYKEGKYNLSFDVYIQSQNIRFNINYEYYFYDNESIITIVYHTDNNHPFNDGNLILSIDYNLTKDIKLIDISYYKEFKNKDLLYGFALNENDRYFSCIKAGIILEDYINKYSKRYLDLYTYIDEGITVIAKIEGYQDQSIFIYRQSLDQLLGRGGYEINFSLFKAYPKDGYIFDGWQGKVTNGESKKTSIYYMDKIEGLDEDYFVIYPVYKKQYIVSYKIDSVCSKSYFANEKYTEGSSLSNVSVHNDIKCRDGYKFLGWYIDGDLEENIIDLNEYIVTSDVTFVAKFGKI